MSKTVEARINASLAPIAASAVGVGVSGEYSVTERFDKDYEMMIEGKTWSTSSNESDNMVEWTITENAAVGKGIVDEFDFAILVQHTGGPLQATVETTVWTKFGIPLFGKPWPRASPLILRPSVSLGRPLGLTTFDDLRDTHWGMLATYNGPFLVRMSHPGNSLANAMQSLKLTSP